MRSSDLARTLLGSALTALPGPALLSVTGVEPDVEEAAVARLLGVRYLAQVAVVTTVARPWASRAGTLADLAHAASMAVLAVRAPHVRRPAALSAVVAAALAVADLRSARRVAAVPAFGEGQV